MFTLTRAQVRDLDRRAIEEFGLPGIVLMENAGRGCAELLMRLNPEKKPTIIFSGPGNNGGDGFVMIRHLDNHGWPVELFYFEPEKQTLDTHLFREVVTNSPVLFHPPSKPEITDWHIVIRAAFFQTQGWLVDAMFGTGLSRPLGIPYSTLSAAINASGNPILAVDIPSGLDCDTGEPLGPTVRATHTATFVAPKRGFLNPKSREWTGQVHVVDIGAPKKLVDEYRT